MSGLKVAVVAKLSSYHAYIEVERDLRVQHLLDIRDHTVGRLRAAHEDHEATVREVLGVLSDLRADVTFYEGSRSQIDGACDLVITVGGDGTLLAASHQIGISPPILGVNSSPEHSVGFFCAARKGSVAPVIASALTGDLPPAILERMRMDVNGRLVHPRVLNEVLFCHECPAATSRYILGIEHPDGRTEEEEQKSSGVWIGPAAGSTAAQRSAGGERLPLDSNKLQYVVREPYTPCSQELQLRVGIINAGRHMWIRNKMRMAKVFVDGHHTVVDVTVGDVLSFQKSDEPIAIVGLRSIWKEPCTGERHDKM